MPDEDADAVAVLLDAIAEHCANPIRLSELLGRIGASGPAVAAAAPTLPALLTAFGAVAVGQDPAAGETTVGLVSPQAGLFLRSIAAHLRTGGSILDDWERPGATDPPYTAERALSGPQFLYLAEQQRLRGDPKAPPLRTAEVVQVVVKARLRGRNQMCYLVIYDEQARQFQLPGGHVRKSDGDPRMAAARELQEELQRFVFDPARHKLSPLGTVNVTQLSRTQSVVTDYHITLFQLLADAEQLPTAPGARWIAEPAALSDASQVNGASLNLVALTQIDEALPGGVRGLPPSIPGVQRRPLREIVRDRPWEVAGLVIGIVGVLLAVIPLLS
jgi:ADP-ribose pyrophosphatase YjhB (NUDIX family)